MKTIYLPVLFIISFLITSSASSIQSDTSLAKDIEEKIASLLQEMTLEEKIGQLNLRGTSSREKNLPALLIQKVRDGEIGAFLNVMNPENLKKLQQVAVEESRHGIPLLFARDVIHGFKTIFPIPLGQAASFNPEIVEEGSQIAALEASSVGIRWTFAPMLDICQDSRWGRIAESPGEDPYLGAVMAEAYVNGFQGQDMGDPTRIAACAKHLIGYGAAIGGRDYNTAIINDELLYNTYVPPFRAAVNANVATIMSSFNEMNGMPATGSKKILMELLREELGFDGFVVSDWNSVIELISHGVAQDEKRAAALAAKAGLDMEMTSRAYEKFLKELVEEELVPEEMVDFYVANILRIKFRLNLFENPYVPENHPGSFYQDAHLLVAKEAAIESTVLLKNEGILPLSAETRILLTGPLANKGREQLGTWSFDGEEGPSVTPKEAMPEAIFAEGLSYSRDMDESQFAAIFDAAEEVDVVVFVAGEEAILSGEAHCRARINLPGAQEALLEVLHNTGKPVILVIMAGRAINITEQIDQTEAVLMMWHPGTMGGPALRDMLYGEAEPAGRLPISWPKAAGQLPYFYNHKNTGRPANPASYVAMEDIKVGTWQSSLGNESHYLDIGYTPLFPFGYGLSYTTFTYDNLATSKEKLAAGESFNVSIDVKNTGDRQGQEVVQLFARDQFGRITRPVRELKRFQKIELAPGATQTVTFNLHYDDFKYYDSQKNYAVEPGAIDLFIGSNAEAELKSSILIQ